jgi:hypothetical protein
MEAIDEVVDAYARCMDEVDSDDDGGGRHISGDKKGKRIQREQGMESI